MVSYNNSYLVSRTICFVDSFMVSFISNCDCVNITVWMHHMDTKKRMEKKLDVNYTGILRVALNKSCKQHTTKQQLFSHLPPIS